MPREPTRGPWAGSRGYGTIRLEAPVVGVEERGGGDVEDVYVDFTGQKKS